MRKLLSPFSLFTVGKPMSYIGFYSVAKILIASNGTGSLLAAIQNKLRQKDILLPSLKYRINKGI